MASEKPEKCVLQQYMNCSHRTDSPKPVGSVRIKDASIQRGDGLNEEPDFLNSDCDIYAHRSCVATYTSSWHIKRHLAKQETSTEPKLKRPRRQAFNFKELCVICAEKCLPCNTKNPSRWRRVVQCRTADRGENQKSFKDVILDSCELRNDNAGEEVRLRIEGTVSDLHAADVQYHKDCMDQFRGKRNITCTTSKDTESHADHAFSSLVEEISTDLSRMWNSVDIHTLYQNYDGQLSRKQLMTKLTDHFGSNLLILSGTGVANILVFKSQVSPSLMKLVNNDEDDDDAAVAKVASVIVRESKLLKEDKNNYNTRINLVDVLASVSSTLLQLLSLISKKLDGSLQAGMVGNIITSMVTNKPTTLQIALGNVARDKSIIEQLYSFGVSSSYDEVLRFKASAALEASRSQESKGLRRSDQGLVQSIADNFDANISSQNGLQSTHSLAILMTQVTQHEENEHTMKRIKKDDMKDDVTADIPVQRYQGPKKPEMPANRATSSPLPLRVLTSQVISVSRACEGDFSFMKSMATESNTPEFNGYNTKIARELGHAIHPSTQAMYLPLVDMTPAEPDTMLTAMVEVQRLTRLTGQEYTIFTNDQQLYKVVVGITWVYHDLFKQFIPRLGGMHTLMNFGGAVGMLMTNTGLDTILQSAFGGVPKLMAGKNFPQNVRALRMVAEELLRSILPDMESSGDMMSTLTVIAERSRTTKLWVDNLLKPVFLMMMFIRAEREADWPLHLWVVRHMMPYFFASGHSNYARSV